MSRFGKPEQTTEHHYSEERLSAYLDGELLPQEREAVERHLSTCQVCQWDLDTLSQTVQWTRELPTLPVPRVFTIQVPTEPQRAVRWRWGFVPALQAATALVALLLFFTVAGDLMLSGFGIARAPEPALMDRPAPAVVEVTRVAELAQEAPAPEMMVAETVVVETVVVEKAVEVQAEKIVAQPMPEAMVTHTPEPASAEEAEPVEAGLEEGEVATGEIPPSEPTVGEAPVESQADEPRLSVAPCPTVELEGPIAAGGEPESAALTASAPAPAPVQPTTLAAAEVEELTAQDRMPARALRRPIVPWLRATEYALGVILLVMVATTLAIMIQRRRFR